MMQAQANPYGFAMRQPQPIYPSINTGVAYQQPAQPFYNAQPAGYAPQA